MRINKKIVRERDKCIITTYAELKNVGDFEIRRELD